MQPPRYELGVADERAIPVAGKDVNGTGQLFEEMRKVLPVRGFAQRDDLEAGIATESTGPCNIQLNSS